MPTISRASLFGKLNSPAYKALEQGTVFCKQRGNPFVQLEHWLAQILQDEGSDLRWIIAHHKLSAKDIASEMTAAFDRLPRGSTSIQDFAPEVELATERAWVYATLMFRDASIRSGYLLVALLASDSLRRALSKVSPTLAALDVDQLIEHFPQSTRRSTEQGLGTTDGSSFGAPPERPQRDMFISYRRAESQHLAGRIFDHLETQFGADRVFKDVDAIPVGARDFAEEIRKQLASTRLMIAVIGPGWLTMRDEAGRRRIDDKEDFVRIEIRWALDNDVPVVPVLFDGAAMPSAADLPTVLRPLARCQSMPVRVDPDFRNDMKRLVEVCRHHLKSAPALRSASKD